VCGYTGGMLWYEFRQDYDILLPQAMDFGTFPHLAYQLMSAVEQELCPLQREVCVNTGGMLWYEFWQQHSILLTRAMEFGTFPLGACQLMSATDQQLCPLQGWVCRYTEGMLWYEFWLCYSILLSRAMEFGTFPLRACCLRSAPKLHVCPFQRAVCKYTGGMLWYEFWLCFSILLPWAIDFGTFPHLAYQVISMAKQHLCPL
jgi:hypothetical protein